VSYGHHSHQERESQTDWPSWLTCLFLVVVFFLCQHDFMYSTKVVEGFNPSEGEVLTALDTGSLSRQIGLLSLGLCSIISLTRPHAVRLRINGMLGRIILFYAGLVFLSLLWADDAALTSKRLVTFAILSLGAVAIAHRFSLRGVVLWTFFATSFYLLLGVCTEIALGTFHPFASGYRLAGTLHPNHQGINCALLVLSGAAASEIEPHKKTFFRAFTAVGFISLILTASRTAFACTLLALAVYFMMVSSKRVRITVAFATLGLVLVVLPLLSGIGDIVPSLESVFMLGRTNSSTESFNGRGWIWEHLRDYIDQRPLLGYGYSGFWDDHHIQELTALSDSDDFGVAESHDAYIQCLLDLGAIGLAAYLLAMLGALVRSFALYKTTRAPEFAFSTGFLVFCLANGVLESAIVVSIFLTFIIMAVLIKLGFRSSVAQSRAEPLMIQKQFGEVLS
jgi:exopolysaccharide production protein ExoQ